VGGKLVRAIIAGQENDGGWGDAMTTALCFEPFFARAATGLPWIAVSSTSPIFRNRKAPGPPSRSAEWPPTDTSTAFILYQLGDQARFREAVRFESALQWFHPNASHLDPEARVCGIAPDVGARSVRLPRATET
jgi:hypothetical protein